MKKAFLRLHFGFLVPFLLLNDGIDNARARMMTLLFFAVAGSALVFAGRFAALGPSQGADIACFIAIALAVPAMNSYLFSDKASYRVAIRRLRAQPRTIKMLHCLAAYSLLLGAYCYVISGGWRTNSF